MGRPPCCDKVGIKKGPWTPEEDIILVSYIQEHGPGNWRAVPTNTGLMRCSKSCRLRWTNYLRPGIKRGNFTPHEEGIIIHLQAQLGNKWAAIATYLPQRTDNDIKNYWNTHLKKKVKKFESDNLEAQPASYPTPYHHFMSNSGCKHNSVLGEATETQSLYASSEENISRLLEGWIRSSSSPLQAKTTAATATAHPTLKLENMNGDIGMKKIITDCRKSNKQYKDHDAMNAALNRDHDLEPILSSDMEKSSCNSHKLSRMEINNSPALSFLERWLFDESTGQVEGVMELPPIF